MLAGDRFKNWIEGLAESWKDLLSGWMVSWVSSAARRGLNAIAPAPDTIKNILDTYETRTGTSVDLKYTIEWLRSMENTPIGWVVGIVVLLLQTAGIALSGSEAVGNEIRYAQNRVLRTALIDPLTALTVWRRRGGVDPTGIDELAAAGLSSEQILKLEESTRAYPSLRDVIGFYAHEVFEPDMVERYGLNDELPPYEGTLFQKIGVDEATSRLYWIDHWQHASWNQVVEMLHRGLITEDEVWEWFRLVEIPPYWRDKLIASAYNVPTRVDVRRFYDLRTIDESRLREIYAAMGYHGKDLDDYVLWTKIYVELPDLIARWKNGWITLDDARDRLISLGLDPAAADELIQTKVKVEEPAAVAESKSLTKTEVYKAIKKGALTVDEGIEVLMDMEYSRKTAELLISINVEALSGSPENMEDFKAITSKYREAVSMTDKVTPEELKVLAGELERLDTEIKSLEQLVKTERDKLVPDEVVPDAASSELKRAEVALNRARAELQRVQVEYNGKVARWKREQEG